jgi:CRISPR-associated endonuclease Csn1
MKRILGLDLGTNSIGWAYVLEAENSHEESQILRLGVRVNPLSSDEIKNFSEGKSITTNADRTLKRHARRNLDRYQLRREDLINLFLREGWITLEDPLNEEGLHTHETLKLRAYAVNGKVELKDLARIFLLINKKRGYKSSRKAKNEDESGQVINEIDIALKLKEENLTPGQYALQRLKNEQKNLPVFYRSDLKREFNQIWQVHQSIYPEILTSEFKRQILGKSKTSTTKIFYAKYGIDTIQNKGANKKLQAYEWRSKAATEVCDLDIMAFALSEVNGNIANSSGYLGEIGDRSKILKLEDLTVGEFQYQQISKNPHSSLKNQIFYRQDYMDEFDKIWEEQSSHHPILSDEIKDTIRNKIIFYQRPLRSQKGLISFCEFESEEKVRKVDGKEKIVRIGSRVIPRSSPLFQHFKIWSILANVELSNKTLKVKRVLEDEEKEELFSFLNIKPKLSSKDVLKILFGKEAKDWKINYAEIDGNKTNAAFYEAYQIMLEYDGYDMNLFKKNPNSTRKILEDFFATYGIDKSILDFNIELKDNEIEDQAQYQLWHLLYSYEGDNSRSGIDKLISALRNKYGFTTQQASILANVNLIQDYGSLSAKAIKKILPYLIDNTYDKACSLAGYNHSSFLTKEENDERILLDSLKILPRNSLRNPVVEKILNQMINVINAVIKHPDLGKPDEIRIELARELKKNAKERDAMVKAINQATRYHEDIREILRQAPFNLKNPTRNDIIRYKLYQELAFNGYKDLYTNTKINEWELFTKKYDIEHIIPKALLFDDSFSNKTLCPRDFNNNVKGDMTAYDCIAEKRAGKLDSYLSRVEDAFKSDSISKSKYQKLLKRRQDIGEGFIERDLRNSQFIAKKAREILLSISRTVTPTTGRITDKLREDWDLINVMKELNLPKYRSLGMTEMEERKFGRKVEVISDWTKRNDHRHHAMDALTVAFTKPAYIQYLNNLSARSDRGSSIFGIEQKYIVRVDGKRRFKAPMPNFRSVAKRKIEEVLISIKAKNKVVTKNINKVKRKGGFNRQITLTPRGQLHKETVYGRSKIYRTKMEKVGSKFDLEKVMTVAKSSYRKALLKRLAEFDNNPKKAFAGKNAPSKIPIMAEDGKTLPDKVKTVTLEYQYTIRKEVGPDLKIEKVIDKGIKKILQKRLDKYGGKPKDAFSNIDEQPIWLDEERGIAIKRVKITGVTNADPLHDKLDHYGKPILLDGKPVPNDFVSTGNNHHVAIYKDEQGNLHESVVSFFEAVARAKAGMPIVDKAYNSDLGWKYLFDMKQNEMFVFPSDEFDPSSIDLLDPKNKAVISPHLFRVQKFTNNDYFFRHHLETTIDNNIKGVTFFRIGRNKLEGVKKIRLNHLGDIVQIK